MMSHQHGDQSPEFGTESQSIANAAARKQPVAVRQPTEAVVPSQRNATTTAHITVSVHHRSADYSTSNRATSSLPCELHPESAQVNRRGVPNIMSSHNLCSATSTEGHAKYLNIIESIAVPFIVSLATTATFRVQLIDSCTSHCNLPRITVKLVFVLHSRFS